MAERRTLGAEGAAGARSGELSVTVERAFQNRGIGKHLLEEALLIARNRGFKNLCLRCSAKMQLVARKFSNRVRFANGAVVVPSRPRSRTPSPSSPSGAATVSAGGRR